MSTAVTNVKYTPEDLLAMPDEDRYELVNGELVERHMGFRSSRIGARLLYLIEGFCEANRLGWVLPADTGYRCFPDDPNKVRKPDVSFVRLDRLPPGTPPQGYATIVPDLAVEVISPNDLFEKVSEKVEEYLSAGVRLVWVVDPAAQAVHVHRPDGDGTILRAGNELTGKDVLPGFQTRVGDLFLTQR